MQLRRSDVAANLIFYFFPQKAIERGLSERQTTFLMARRIFSDAASYFKMIGKEIA